MRGVASGFLCLTAGMFLAAFAVIGTVANFQLRESEMTASASGILVRTSMEFTWTLTGGALAFAVGVTAAVIGIVSLLNSMRPLR
jgi:hypothetical protein